jgi:hypothetical protein
MYRDSEAKLMADLPEELRDKIIKVKR